MQLADEDQSDAVRRDRRSRDRRERADASVRSTGLGVATSASRRGMCKVIGLTNSCSFLPEANHVTFFGRRLNASIESFFGNDLLGSPLRRFERTNKRAASFARESDLYPQSRIVYPVVRLREDPLQLQRPNPAVQQ